MAVPNKVFRRRQSLVQVGAAQNAATNDAASSVDK
jgi:hypothetical protein